MNIDHSQHQEERPRVYVASLSDYNGGTLHGVWIDAKQSAEAIQAEVDAMLENSPEAQRYGTPAEEWAIHDYEGFGPIRLGEWESFEVISSLAHSLDQHGDAFAAYVAMEGLSGLEEDLGGAFTEAYQGHYDDVADYAFRLAEDLGTMSRYQRDDYSMFQPPDDLTTEWPFTCIDWERAGRELVLGGDIWTAEAPCGVYVFNNH
jgi:antirestriction protein